MSFLFPLLDLSLSANFSSTGVLLPLFLILTLKTCPFLPPKRFYHRLLSAEVLPLQKAKKGGVPVLSVWSPPCVDSCSPHVSVFALPSVPAPPLFSLFSSPLLKLPSLPPPGVSLSFILFPFSTWPPNKFPFHLFTWVYQWSNNSLQSASASACLLYRLPLITKKCLSNLKAFYFPLSFLKDVAETKVLYLPSFIFLFFPSFRASCSFPFFTICFVVLFSTFY